MNLEETAKIIIKRNVYLTIATSDGKPWIAPVHYGVDNNYVFYFLSQPTSKHSQHIMKNPSVAVAIFDSTQPEGKGNGLQIKAKAYLVPEEEVSHALRFYSTVFFPLSLETLKTVPYKLYKIIPERVYLLDPNAKVDKRVEISLK